MAAGSTAAKITRPRLSRVFQRERLLNLLDYSCERPIIWVSGPAGSGKTTLVCDYLDARNLPCLWYQVDEGDSDIATFFYYMGLAAKKAAFRKPKPLPHLTPEYSFGIPTFTKRYFENLFMQLKTPHVIVFDNYQEVPAESPFHEVIENGLSEIPEGINVIVLSRVAPPPSMARLRAGDKIAIVGGSELCLTPDESKRIIQLHMKEKLPKETLHQLHSVTQRWAAGLVLLIARAKTESGEALMPADLTHEDIFHYFAGEIFDKMDNETRDFLLKTAFLPRITPRMAESLTGVRSADRILSDLNRKNYFTEKHSAGELTYQYHLLFREFLLSRAKTVFLRDVITRVRQSAAELLEESGQVEAAAELSIEAGDWERLTRLIRTHAQLLLPQGRSKTLEKWLTSIPKEIVETAPWLLYWLGVCRLPFRPPQSRGFFEQALQLFRGQQDAAGIYLSWAGAVETIMHELGDLKQLDRWIALLGEIVRAHPAFPSPVIEDNVASCIHILELCLGRGSTFPPVRRMGRRGLRNVRFKSEPGVVPWTTT